MKYITLALTLTLSLNAGIAFASCDHADLCTPGECRARQALVHPRCDVTRSCVAQNLTDAEYQVRLNRNQQCLTARQAVSQCFSHPDAGHQVAIQQVQQALAVCTARLN